MQNRQAKNDIHHTRHKKMTGETPEVGSDVRKLKMLYRLQKKEKKKKRNKKKEWKQGLSL